MLATNAASLKMADLAARMLIRAGQSVMDSRDDKGLEYFREAHVEAEQDLDRLEATVGVCFAASELGLADEAGKALADFSAMKIHGIDVAARKAIVHLVLSSRMGGIEGALEAGAEILPLLEDVRDPLIITSFLNCYGHFLGLAAHYVDALHVADRQIATADEYRLAFALPHGYLVRAASPTAASATSRKRADIARAEELAARTTSTSQCRLAPCGHGSPYAAAR